MDKEHKYIDIQSEKKSTISSKMLKESVELDLYLGGEHIENVS